MYLIIQGAAVNERTALRFMVLFISKFTSMNYFYVNDVNDLDMFFLPDYIMILKLRILFLYFMFASVPNLTSIS